MASLGERIKRSKQVGLQLFFKSVSVLCRFTQSDGQFVPHPWGRHTKCTIEGRCRPRERHLELMLSSQSLILLVLMKDDRYAGPSPRIILCTMRRTLYLIRCSTGNQCSSRSTGVMCSLQDAPVSIRAAAFCTFCNRLI